MVINNRILFIKKLETSSNFKWLEDLLKTKNIVFDIDIIDIIKKIPNKKINNLLKKHLEEN